MVKGRLKSMGKVNINERIRARNVRLNKVSAEKINGLPKDGIVEISQKTKAEIIHSASDSLSIKANTKITIVPESLFTIEIEHIIDNKLVTKLSDKEVTDNIKELLIPIAPEISFIVSFLTKKMLETHIILPPKLDIKIE